ncbi:hypothetical protein PHYBOEH_010025 [Phytophthora boehmeriae]|uniref:M96 mating-specific protein family n=1 Tax=Phytophthora boehmeriae TaxID=109152 RepID=A0A8T1VPB3_9STRA|nr:hypothetical protein PHYBOEH_010025 [Phytophthora boehmeriae]
MDDQTSFFLDDGDLTAFMTDSWNGEPLTGSPLPIPTIEQSCSATTLVEKDKTAETVASKSAKQGKTKWKRRRDRNRPYREIPQLRTQIIDLESKLQDEQAKASERAIGALSGRDLTTMLKAKLSENLKRMQMIEQSLGDQMQKLVQVLPHSGSTAARVLQYEEKDLPTFRELADSVDEQYKKMNRVLRLSGLHEATSEMINAYICRSGGASSDLLKVCTSMVLPYESHLIERAVWKNVKNDEAVVLGPKQSLDNLELSLGSATRVSVQKHKVTVGDSTCTMTMVIKQFTEKDRLVHVWHTIAEWQCVGTARNVKTHEYGWSFAKPVKETAASVWQSCVLMSPAVLTGLTPSESKETTQILARLYQTFIVWRLQLLENQVIDETIQKKKSTNLFSIIQD